MNPHPSARGTVGVAALDLLDPKARRVSNPYRWRMAVELTRLLQQMGYEVAWWQVGDGWRIELLPGVPIYGILRGEMQLHTHPLAAEDFLEKAGDIDWAIYFDFILAYPQVHDRSLAIADGMTWDDSLHEARLATESERREWQRRVWMALQAPLKVVSTDTALIQWAMATWPGLGHRFVYIPNFVPELGVLDLREHPLGAMHQERESRDTVRVLFPGPLTPEAGISEVVRAMDSLLERHAALEFFIWARGAPPIEDYLCRWVSERPRSCFESLLLVAPLLEAVDIVLFPAKSGQGTTMACLQAMNAGKVVVVAQTGGLTDLVLHDHNGLVIPPQAARIAEAIDELIAQPDRRTTLGRHARATVREAFSLRRWRDRWRELIRAVIPG